MWPAWVSRDRRAFYRELEHPADLLLEIVGPDLAGLFANALFALYDQTAELDAFATEKELWLSVEEASPADALRALLAEALYRLETEGFVAVGAEIELEDGSPLEDPLGRTNHAGSDSGCIKVRARLWGENATAGRHNLTTEIKAVTYHRLTVQRTSDGSYRATVLFDV
jgi:SHS2 domain-containing protein